MIRCMQKDDDQEDAKNKQSQETRKKEIGNPVRD